MAGSGYRFRFSAVVALLTLGAALAGSAPAATDLSVEAMKGKLSSANLGDRPHLCVRIAERQLAEADRLYTGADVEQAQTKLTEVVAYSELARDYSIQSHKYQKQTEIAVRVMTRKLTELMHVLGHDDQVPVREAIGRLQRVRDDLLAAMFKKGAK